MTETPETESVETGRDYFDPTADVAPLSVDAAASIADGVMENVASVIVGKRTATEHIMTTVLGRGHLLLDDVPGVGKTMLARTFARSVGGDFKRIQFTPDLLPADLTGTNIFNQQTSEFEFRPGPLFGNVVLGDEINRAPPKTQSALLEGMEEEQVTTDGVTRRLPDPFFVIATQNAVEQDRTYELPAAELDRFMKKISLGYPSRVEEETVLERIVGGHPIDDVEAVTDIEQLGRARATAANVTVSSEVREYVTELAHHTRDQAALGVSPRGAIDLLRAAQGRAILESRDFVLPDDVKLEAPSVWSHRIRAEAGGPFGGEQGRTVVDLALNATPVR